MSGACFKALEGARILVTGAGGFVGANLVRAILAQGLPVDALVSAPGPSPRLDSLAGRAGLARVVRDLRQNPAPLIDQGGYDLVFHLAAAMPGSGARDGRAVNVEATLRLAQALARRGGLLLYAGSVSEYAPQARPMDEDTPAAPETAYGREKAEAVAGLATLGEDRSWCVLRLFGVYGPLEGPMRLLPYIARQLSRGERAALTHGGQVRDFVFVEDVARAFLTAASAPRARGRVYNIGSGTGVSVREAGLMAGELLGRPDLLDFGAVSETGASPSCFIAAPGRAAAELGWTPRVHLREGVARTVRWAVGEEHV